MTRNTAIGGTPTRQEKVNLEGNAWFALEAGLDALRRSGAATAGASNVIADRLSKIGEGEDLLYISYPIPEAIDWRTLGTADVAPREGKEFVFRGLQRALEGPSLDFRAVNTALGGLANLELVRQYNAPAEPTAVNTNPVAAYRQARRAVAEGRRDALARISKDLDAVAAAYAQDAPKDVLGRLSDAGVGQLTIARAVGVTPTAIRKWRRGDQPKPDHRGRLARFAALHSSLAESGMHDPAGWLDVPVSSESTVTPLDMFVGGRPDLAVLLGGRAMDPQEALDAFDPTWRQSQPIDPDYEIVVLEDGSRSAVPRRGGAS